MKLFEIKIDREAGRLTVRRECEEHMTAQQKYRLALAAIGGTTLAALVHMVGWVALVASVVALLLCGAGVLMKD